MPPSLLASFLSALSCTGFGLLMWTGLTIALLHLRGGGSAPSLHQLQWLALSIGSVLVGIGPIAAGIGRGRLRRALAQAPSAWATRAMRLSIAAVLLAVGLIVLLLFVPPAAARTTALVTLGLVLLLVTFAAITATALAWGTAVPAVAAWQHPLALPTRLLIAITGGLAALYLLMSLLFVTGSDGGSMLMTLTVLGVTIALCLLWQWRDVDRDAARTSLPAVGTDPRRRVLRLTTAALLVVAPLVAWALATVQLLPASVLLLAIGTLLLTAASLERALFLVEGATATPVGVP